MESPSPGVSVVSETHPITVEEWQHRFKVVKIVSKEPRKRGRWYCMDFNDPPATSSNILEPSLATTKTPDSLSHTHPVTTGTSAPSLINNNQTTNLAQENKVPASQPIPEAPVVDEKTFDHLMFAVREEVVVLKERINELMSKISKLELENSILRTHASAETLALLQNNQSNHTALSPQATVSNQSEPTNLQNQTPQANPNFQTHSQPQSQSQLQPQIQTHFQPQPQTQIQPQPQPQIQPQPQSQIQPQPLPLPQYQPQAQIQPLSQSQLLSPESVQPTPINQ